MGSDGPVRSIRWSEVFPATLLVRAARSAADIRKLLLAAIAAALMPGGWWVLATLQEGTLETPPSSEAAVDAAEFENLIRHATQANPNITASEIRQLPQYRALQEATRNAPRPGTLRYELLSSWTPFASGGITAGSPSQAAGAPSGTLERILTSNPVYASWEYISRPGRLLFARTATAGDVFWLALAALWGIIVWSFFGGVICRLTAVELATEQRAGIGEALAFTARRWRSFLAAPLLPLLGMALIVSLVLLVPGLFLRMGTFGEIVAGLLWPLLLLFGGVTLATLGVGLYFGWALLWGAIATDNSDGFDAVSRTYAYTYQRPFHFAGYLLTASFLGWFLWILISIFAFAIVELTSWGASWTGGDAAWVQRPAYAVPLLDYEVAQRDLLSPLGAGLIEQDGYRNPDGGLRASTLRGLAVDGVRLLVLGFVYSYFWTIATAIYMLLRRSVDATELDEVWQAEPAVERPLPMLVPDEAGVPTIETTPATDDTTPPTATDDNAQ